MIATALAGWLLVGRGVQHVTSHLTLSLNSPSHEVRELAAGADAPGAGDEGHEASR